MKWWDLKDDERQAWRNDPVTKAFFVTIYELTESAERGALANVRLGQDSEAKVKAGVAQGLAEAIEVAGRDK